MIVNNFKVYTNVNNVVFVNAYKNKAESYLFTH